MEFDRAQEYLDETLHQIWEVETRADKYTASKLRGIYNGARGILNALGLKTNLIVDNNLPADHHPADHRHIIGTQERKVY